MKQILLVSGGAWQSEYLKRIYPQAQLVIGIDGAVPRMLKAGLLPHIAIGDFDTAGLSVAKLCQSAGIEIIHLSRDKELTDTQAALELAFTFQPQQVVIVGALGGARFDHALANVYLLEVALAEGVPATILGPHYSLQLLAGPASMQLRKEHYNVLSLQPISNKVSGVTLTEVRFPLENESLRRGQTRSLSNEWLLDAGQLFIQSGKLLIIRSS